MNQPPTEHQEQAAVVSYLQAAYPDALFWSVPNGAHLSGNIGHRSASMNILKSAGLLPGVSDLIIFEPRGGYSCMFLEMKRTSGSKVHENQEWFLVEVEKRGAFGVVAFGAEDAIFYIDRYLGGKITIDIEQKFD